MQYLHEPITIIFQMKALKTNQFNQLRQFIKKIDPQASLNLKTQSPSLQNLAQSSTQNEYGQYLVSLAKNLL